MVYKHYSHNSSPSKTLAQMTKMKDQQIEKLAEKNVKEEL